MWGDGFWPRDQGFWSPTQLAGRQLPRQPILTSAHENDASGASGQGYAKEILENVGVKSEWKRNLPLRQDSGTVRARLAKLSRVSFSLSVGPSRAVGPVSCIPQCSSVHTVLTLAKGFSRGQRDLAPLLPQNLRGLWPAGKGSEKLCRGNTQPKVQG